MRTTVIINANTKKRIINITPMEILQWLDKPLDEIKESLGFGKYFDTILIEEGIGVFFLFNPDLGIDLKLSNAFVVEAVHFYSGTQEGVKEFIDTLPLDLKFSLSREQTLKLLGQPAEQGGGGYSLLYGTTPHWDKYVMKDYILHLQFSKALDQIELVTVYSLFFTF